MNPSDRKRFEQFFHLHYSPLCNYARKVTGNDVLAEDIVQDLFMQLWQKDQLAHIDNLERYLLRAIKFKSIDQFRKHKTIVWYSLADSAFDQLSEDLGAITEEEIEPLLHYFAAKLPPKTRQVFLLSRESGMTYNQIAEEMNISVKTVEHQMGRALKQMKAILKTSGFYSLIFFL